MIRNSWWGSETRTSRFASLLVGPVTRRVTPAPLPRLPVPPSQSVCLSRDPRVSPRIRRRPRRASKTDNRSVPQWQVESESELTPHTRRRKSQGRYQRIRSANRAACFRLNVLRSLCGSSERAIGRGWALSPDRAQRRRSWSLGRSSSQIREHASGHRVWGQRWRISSCPGGQ